MSYSTIILLIGLVIFFADTCTCTRNFTCDPECTRENEECQCGSACQTTCPTLGQQCPIQTYVCQVGCYCKEGYARITDDCSPCILIKCCPGRG